MAGKLKDEMIFNSDGTPYVRLKIEDICYEGYIALIGGIAREAVRSYVDAIKKKNTHRKETEEQFIRSAWFRRLTGLNGDYIIRRATQIAEDEIREEKRTGKKKKPRRATTLLREVTKECGNAS